MVSSGRCSLKCNGGVSQKGEQGHLNTLEHSNNSWACSHIGLASNEFGGLRVGDGVHVQASPESTVGHGILPAGCAKQPETIAPNLGGVTLILVSHKWVDSKKTQPI